MVVPVVEVQWEGEGVGDAESEKVVVVEGVEVGVWERVEVGVVEGHKVGSGERVGEREVVVVGV